MPARSTTTPTPNHQPSTIKSAQAPLSSNHPTPANPLFTAAAHAADGKRHLLLAASGSVATIKIPNILAALCSSPLYNHSALSVRLVLTASAARFLSGASAEQPTLARLRATIPNLDGIHLDADEWDPPWTRGAPILHIELRRWADLMVVAPLSANAMAGMVAGRAGDLLGSVLRAWDTDGSVDGGRRGGSRRGGGRLGGGFAVGFGTEAGTLASTGEAARDDRLAGGREGSDASGRQIGKPKKVLLAPAMNSAMWLHPVTKSQLDVLEGDWGLTKEREVVGAGMMLVEGFVEVLRPGEKELACGDVGIGAMVEWTQIVRVIEERLGLGKELGPEIGKGA